MDVYRFVSAASTNATTIVSGSYLVRGYYVTNTNETQSRFLHFYDGAVSGTPKWTVTIPIESGANPSWDNGIWFHTAISFALSTSPSSLVAVGGSEITGYIVYSPLAF